MKFAVFGPLRLQATDGGPIESPTGNPASLLTALLLRANEHVSLDLLIDLLWRAEPPRSHRANLQSYVSRLRGLGVHIYWSTAGYLLCAEPGSIDIHRFIRYAEDGLAYSDADDQGKAVEAFRDALDLYRALPFSDGKAGPFEGDIFRLGELHASVVERLSEIDVANGRYATAICRLRALVNEHPLRETLWGRLISALARADRTAEALGVYEQARQTIRDELGVNPGRPLRRVHLSLLADG
jgi:DNA-binding SARP family transcriptional activator